VRSGSMRRPWWLLCAIAPLSAGCVTTTLPSSAVPTSVLATPASSVASVASTVAPPIGPAVSPEPSLAAVSFTLVNSSSIALVASFATDASGGCEGLYPGQRATMQLVRQNPSNGVGHSGTVVLTSRPVATFAPLPNPSPDLGCQGG
jgi:hypothetical protein